MSRFVKLTFSRIIGILAFFAITAVLASCQTEMQIEEDIDMYKFEESNAQPYMEFIGFKAGDAQWGNSSKTDWSQIKNTSGVRSIGSALQLGGLAVDKSDSYFGVYSLQEIQLYKSKKRYVTFVEIPDFDLTYSVNMNDKVLECWLFFASIIGIPVVPFWAARPYKTTMYMRATGNIYVYDTQKQEIIYKKNVFNLADKKVFKGSWRKSSDVGKQKVYDYYANMMATAILKDYDNVKKSPLFEH